MEEQKELVYWLDFRAKRGMPVDVKVLRKLAKKYVRNPNFKASKNWAENFLKKWNVDRGKPEVFPP